MMPESIIALESFRLEAHICFETNDRKAMLLPCDSELYPEVKIECFKDVNAYEQGDKIEVDVVAMQSSNGQSYFYSY